MNLKNKKAAFFDMDGTLVDSETLYYQTRIEIFDKYGFDYQKVENDKLLASGFDPTLRYFQQKVNDKQLGKKIFDESLALFNQRVEEGKLQVKPGAEKLLYFLQQKGIKPYITSSSDIEKNQF